MNQSVNIGRLRFAFLILLGFVTGCGSTEVVVDEPVSEMRKPRLGHHEGLNSTLWALRSPEYAAATLGTYRSALVAVELGLADSTWTAALEQRAVDDYELLPPAVVLDVDETVLNNGLYQVDLVVEDRGYALESWNDFVRQERATPIPGALHFTRYAASRGVTVIYLSNRRAEVEESTRNNLRDLGFPIDNSFDVVLSRGEKGWDSGEKTSRRTFVSRHYRVLALIGDNLGDFTELKRGLDAREMTVHTNHELWGSRWFMLPNPQYGSWESASFNSDYALTPEQRRKEKLNRLIELKSR